MSPTEFPNPRRQGSYLNHLWDTLYKKSVGHTHAMIFIITKSWVASPNTWPEFRWLQARGNLRREIRAGGQEADQRSRRVAYILQLPSRALEAHPNDKLNRKRLRQRTQPDPKDQGLFEQENGTVHGLQADDVSKEKMAKAQRHKSTA